MQNISPPWGKGFFGLKWTEKNLHIDKRIPNMATMTKICLYGFQRKEECYILKKAVKHHQKGGGEKRERESIQGSISFSSLELKQLTCFSSILCFFRSLCFSASVSIRCFGFKTCFVIFTSKSVIWRKENHKFLRSVKSLTTWSPRIKIKRPIKTIWLTI